MNKHWKSLAAALALVSVLGVAGCGGTQTAGSSAKSASAAAEGKTNMRVAYSPSLCEASTVVAYEKGFFKEEGINPEMINIQGASETEALGTDKVDGMQTLVSKSSSLSRTVCR